MLTCLTVRPHRIMPPGKIPLWATSAGRFTNGYTPPDYADRRKKALERCNSQIGWYEKHKKESSYLYRLFQVAAVGLSGITPVLILWSGLPEPVKALPAALGAVAIATTGIFHWRDNWSRFAYTAEVLKSELLKFETRTSKAYRIDLNEEETLDNFVYRIEAALMEEVSDWQAQQSRATPSKR